MITHLLLSTGGDDAAATTGGIPTDLLLNIGLFALLAVVIIFMFRSSRKRRADAEKLQTQMTPGVEVMTQHGIYGTLVSLDEEKNEAIIETTPGTKLRVHRQTLARVVEPDDVVTDEQELDAELGEITPADDPAFGERADDTKPKRAPRKKPTE
jgi:preprotein translocase subunit YajC